MNQDELRQLEDKCIQECPPFCTAACPVHVDVKAMIAEVARGDFNAALKHYRKAVPFPNVLCRICDQPCQDVCKRLDIDEDIDIRGLERACVDLGEMRPEKARQLPQRRGSVAVVGGGISGMTAAYDLKRKGYAVTLFDSGNRLGGSLWQIDRDYLPRDAIHADVDAFVALDVDIQLNAEINGAALRGLHDEFDAVYLAVGPLAADLLGLDTDEHGSIKVDPVTFVTSLERVYAGGGMRWGKEMHSSVTSISEGRRAAISIDRQLQGVSLTASRINEGPYKSRLFTSTKGFDVCPPAPMAAPLNGYDRNEAIEEAQRCIQCECMECVKVCEYLQHFQRYPRRYVREIYNNLSIVKGTRYANSLINACTLCGLCAEVCPEHLHMGEVNLDARRTMVEQKRMPESAHDFGLRDLAFNNGDSCTLARHAPGKTRSDAVFFPGCQLAGSSPEAIERVYADFGHLLPGQDVGLMLGCCGAPAYWAGRVDLFDATMDAWRNQLDALGNPRLILACSTCRQMFQHALPDVETVSLWDLFDHAGLAPAIAKGSRQIAIHDPCSARYDHATQDSVRHVVESLGYRIEELPRSREKTTCCGYGGLVSQANPDVARKMVEARIAESSAPYVTYCAMCRDQFAAHGKPTWHVLDLIYGRATVETAVQPGPDWSQRQHNRAGLKRRLVKTLWGEDMDGPHSYETIRLTMSDAVRKHLDERLILESDVQRVIEHAEHTGSKLIHGLSGHFLASHRPTNVTYWVEYLPDGDGFVVFNAYSHRMEILGSDSP